MTYRSEFRRRLFVELPFSQRHLHPLRRLFQQLQAGSLPDDMSFDALDGLDRNMVWHYAMNSPTLDCFDRCLMRSNLNRSLRIIDDARLFAACFIVVTGGVSQKEFHIDYGEPGIPAGVSGTLLTPLFPLDNQTGHLDYLEDGRTCEYRYQCGRALLFDGRFEHRTQAYEAPPGVKRVLVSWSIASSSQRHREPILKVIESQMIGY